MTSADDTIVAVATPLGQGGLGVVRLSGPQALNIADVVFPLPSALSKVPSHTLHHGWIKFNSAPIDEAVAAVFKTPRSYTGEDVVEFSCHGSPAILKEVVNACIAHGARPAEPGEFTQRAYLNGKLDLAQAEAVADVIHANSSRARQAASDQLRGVLSARLKAMRERLITLLAKIEANLDFAEEGTPYIDRSAAIAELKTVSADLEALLSTSLNGRFLRDGVRVAIVGRPNVGKSSLFNALLARDRAIVTANAGTTRDTLEEMVEWNGYSIRLIDTAGLRETDNEAERIGNDRARRAQQTADVALLVLDQSHRLTEDDQTMISSHAAGIIALNKSDERSAFSEKDWAMLAPATTISVSAKTGAGLVELKTALLEKIPHGSNETEDATLVTNLRHVGHLENARDEIKQTIAALVNNDSEESVALPLRAALLEFGMITGEAVTEDVLSSIFRQFCIGK